MPQLALDDALAEVRAALLDRGGLRRAVASGARRGTTPAWRRVEVRPVQLKAGERLQVVRYDERQAFTANAAWPEEAATAVDELTAEPFAHWHVETDQSTLQLRVTKKGDALLSRSAPTGSATTRSNDRPVEHLLAPDDPLFGVLGAGAAKRRQVDSFLRVLAGVEAELPDGPLRVVDLGCGNAYLTFAVHRYLSRSREVQLVGVDSKAQSREHGSDVARRLGVEDAVRFVEAPIADAPLSDVDVVLALHACDTATDDALAAAVRAGARLVLAAPCCHHDLQRQLREGAPPDPYALLTRHGILRERFGDVLTDALRAAVLRLVGYRVDVVEFTAAEDTPRNVLLRAVRTGAPPTEELRRQYADLIAAWGLCPALAERLAPELAAAAVPG
ncbi:methyltransferase family protein [Motilibacter rhizosphaerae]|uniref:Methyltransferase family protein n=1 Tax=Motilibacter rhizosphaerae TaxID=598652 RepID=A0A4V2F4G3_9ACTN|nr:methyltransferase [Motilibacter rhizosphaerae]RZS87507.1 methyltransferase family protein [Motilibacter rhizosphaerae]